MMGEEVDKLGSSRFWRKLMDSGEVTFRSLVARFWRRPQGSCEDTGRPHNSFSVISHQNFRSLK